MAQLRMPREKPAILQPEKGHEQSTPALASDSDFFPEVEMTNSRWGDCCCKGCQESISEERDQEWMSEEPEVWRSRRWGRQAGEPGRGGGQGVLHGTDEGSGGDQRRWGWKETLGAEGESP